MRIFLAIVLLLNSFVAVGAVTDRSDYAEIEALIQTEPVLAERSPVGCQAKLKNGRRPAAAEECDTAAELMSSNVGGRDFSRICQKIVAEDEGCKKLKPEKRMSCNAKRENELLSTADLLSKAGQCIKGFAWDSMVDLGKFVLELIKMLVGAQISSVTAMIKFMTDSEYRENALRAAGSAVNAGSKLGMAFLRSSSLYFAREFPRNFAKYPFNPLMAIGETLFGPMIRFMTDAVQQIAAHYIPQYQCMNGTAKLYTICRVLGDFIMPPAFLFSFLKYGARGLSLMAKTAGPKIARVAERFREANEIRLAAKGTEAARGVKETRITVDQLRHPPGRIPRVETAPRPSNKVTASPEVHPPRPRPAAPLEKPIEQHSADELIEVARSEHAETASVNLGPSEGLKKINESVPLSAGDDVVKGLAETAEYKAVLEGLNGAEKAEAAKAIEALSGSGASPGIVVGLFEKYAPHFRTEVARTPAGSENLWSKMSRYMKREKAAGKSDDVIRRQIDEAFKCD